MGLIVLAITSRDLRLLFQQSGNQCAFAGCTQRLTFDANRADRAGVWSEVAHIVAQSPDGPRGNHPLALDLRDRYENLILLCELHHTLVDTQVSTYPVERLQQMKFDHEALIAEATRRAVQARASDQHPREWVTDQLFSSMLPVERLPKYVFSVACGEMEAQLRKRLLPPRAREAAVFVTRAKRLYCFHDLRNDPGPFADIVRGCSVERDLASEFWVDQDRRRWYVDLLNRTLNKITGRRHLNLDREHRRYYFDMLEPDSPRTVVYRPMNQVRSEIKVVWRPVTRKTGLPKKFWYHRAIALTFVQASERSWTLALRPELRVTRNGRDPVVPRRVGGKVTKKKARMFNFDVLTELNFWRDYLFDGGALLAVTFGNRGVLAISANFLGSQVSWPGVPTERAMEFKNAVVEEGLFDMPLLDLVAAEEDEDDLMGFEEE